MVRPTFASKAKIVALLGLSTLTLFMLLMMTPTLSNMEYKDSIDSMLQEWSNTKKHRWNAGDSPEVTSGTRESKINETYDTHGMNPVSNVVTEKPACFTAKDNRLLQRTPELVEEKRLKPDGDDNTIPQTPWIKEYEENDARQQTSGNINTVGSMQQTTHDRTNRKNEGRLLIAVPVQEHPGYVKFTGSIFRTLHENSKYHVHVFSDPSTKITYPNLKEWYGGEVTLHPSIEEISFVTKIIRILEHFIVSEYETLLVGSDDLILSENIYNFIKLNLNHTDLLQTYRNTTNCSLRTDGLCHETNLTIIGSVMTKSVAKLLVKCRDHFHDVQGIDVALEGVGLRMASPVHSMSIRMGQHVFSSHDCMRYAQSINFNRCEFSPDVRNGLEFYLDKCNQPTTFYNGNTSSQNDVFYSRPVVSLGLYGGANPRYTDGALANSELMFSIYPEWKMWVYHDNSAPAEILKTLCKRDVKLINLTGSKIQVKSLWRFFVASENVERYIIRDIDSRFSFRERAAVDEWIESGKKFHIMRDHPAHTEFAMNAGMWGGKHDAFPQMRDVLEKMNFKKYYHQDQDFLTSQVWSRARESVFQHDAFPTDKWGEVHPFPTARVGYEHVGSVYINGKIRAKAIQLIKEALEKRNRVERRDHV